MAYETILVANQDGVGTITLNRPQALNAINQQMLAELDRALTDLETDDDVRVIVMTGSGRAFSAGRDLKEIGGSEHRTGADVWSRLETIGKPVIAAVNGLCYTGALSMLTCFDLVVASEDAVFADTHTRFGMVHGGGATQRLRDVVGPRKAKELIFACEPIGAAEAERIGLVNKVVPADDLQPAVQDLADKIKKNDPMALATAKRLINDGMKWGTAVGFELEAREYQRQRREQAAQLKARTDSFFDTSGQPSA
jgi:enoyl-CoA hydratase/carnithine racemase